MARIPVTELTCPSRPNSPNISIFSMDSCGMIPIDASIPTAIGRSNAVPSFLISAGNRLMVTLFGGRLKLELRSAILTRSPASLTQADRYPTIFIMGRPSCISVSTDISVPSTPRTSPLKTLLYISYACSFLSFRTASPFEAHII